MGTDRGLGRWFWAALSAWFVVASVVGVAFAFTVLRDRNEALAQGARRAQASADLAAENAARMLEGADVALLAIAARLFPYDWDRIASDRDTWLVVRAWADRLEMVPRFVVVDENGRLRLTSDIFPSPAHDLSKRGYFQHHQSVNDDRPLIGEPIVGSLSGQRIFTLGRRLSRMDGSFAGLINAGIPPETFQAFYRSMDLGKGGFASLQRKDGLVLVREPVLDGVIGSRADYAKVLPSALTDAWAAVEDSISPFDGQRRFVAFRRVPGFDALAVVGVSRGDILNVWLRDALRSAAILAIALIVLAGLLVLIFRRRARELAAQGALLASERRFGMLFDQMVSAFAVHEIILGPDGKAVDFRFLDVNPAFERMTGLSRSQVIGHTAREVIPDLESVWVDTFGAVAATGIPAHLTSRSGFLDKVFEVSAFRPEPGQFACTFIDATERERKDAQLRIAVAQLTEQNTELQRFAFVAAHDLKEPLRTIVAFTQLLQKRTQGTLDHDGNESMDLIINAAKHMHFLIQDLLAYSRISAKDIRFASVALNEACASALTNLRESILESKAEIDIGPLPTVVCDGAQIIQLFQNLIANAVKFARPGVSPQVKVRAEVVDGVPTISVADNGIGIAASSQDIFEIFRRLHTQQDYPGTGIGLAICRRIVQRHGGRIWVESTPGQGATFFFTLGDRESDGETPILSEV